MSRVKQPIEDAKTFAASEEAAAGAVEDPALVPPDMGPREGRDGHVERAGDRTTVIVGGEPMEFYTTEQDRVNVLLKDRVHEVEAAFVALCRAHTDAVAALRDEQLATKADRDQRAKEFTDGFRWPELAPVKSADIVAQYSLECAADYVEGTAAAMTAVVPKHKASQDVLEKLRHKVNLNRTLEEYADLLTDVSAKLVDDGPLAREVLLPLHHMAFSEEFNYVKGEMAKVDGRVQPLLEELARVRATKADAMAVEDINAVEEYSFREVDLQEQIMELQRKRLDVVVGASDDAGVFREKFYALRDKADEATKRHQGLVEERVARLAVDMEKLADFATEEENRDKEAQKAFVTDIDRRNEELLAVTQQERDVWAKIMQLLEQRAELAAKREGIVKGKFQAIGQNCKRRADFEALSKGIMHHTALLEATKESLALAQRYADDVAHYVAGMCAVTEKKDVEEEAVRLRIKEQQAYLEMYTAYRHDVDELVHRKETRVLAANRMARHLELEIREATETLDPNKRRYEADHAELQGEVARLVEQLAALAAKAQQQSELWKPTEEQLEEDGVEFDPPDIVAERERCERKTAALNNARDFVTAEQETVDRDTMSLRKLRTSAQVAQDGLDKRRQAKSEAAAADGTSASPP